MVDIPALTMVLGGASSGKSFFAERFVIAAGGPRSYVATAQAFDAEMAQKIADHQSQRAQDNWSTIEAPLDVSAAFDNVPVENVALLDCATLWLTNLMLADMDIGEEIELLLDILAAHPRPVVVVTNEVGQGIVPQHKTGRTFRTIQGRFNATLAARADLVVQVTAGLPLCLKGQMPTLES